jgi:spore coat protein U-like protein
VALSCTVSTTDLAFGSYDPIVDNASAPREGTGGLLLNCTEGYNATVTLDQGQYPGSGSTDAAPLRQMSDGGSNRLSYSLYQDAGRTTIWGNTYGTALCTSGSVTVYGRITGGQNVPVGLYSDVVLVTVNI